MARKQNRILPMENSGASGGLSRRRILMWSLMGLMVVLIVAYIDGGEEPLYPMSETVALPESAG